MSKLSDNPSKDSEMVTIEARDLVSVVAGPREWGDNRKGWLARAARRLGFSYTRTRSIFYGEARVIRAEEWIRLNEEAEQLKKSARERQEALHDLDLLAGAAVAARREVPRPLGVGGGDESEARPGPGGTAAGRPVR